MYLTTDQIAKRYRLSRRATCERLRNDKRFGELVTQNVTPSGRIKKYLLNDTLDNIMKWPRNRSKSRPLPNDIQVSIKIGGVGVPELEVNIESSQEQIQKFIKWVRAFGKIN